MHLNKRGDTLYSFCYLYFIYNLWVCVLDCFAT